MTKKEIKIIEAKSRELRKKLIKNDKEAFLKYSFLISLLNDFGYDLEFSTVYKNNIAVLRSND